MKKILVLMLAILTVATVLSSCQKEEEYNPLANGPGTAKEPEDIAETNYDIPVIEGLIYDYDLTQYITLPDYKDPGFRYNRYATDDAGIQRSLLYTKLSSPSVSVTKAEHEAMNGNMVVFDYTSTFELTGEPSISGKNVSIILGQEMFAPGFDSYIEGLSAGHSGKFDFTFPATWSDIASVSGKTLKLEVTVTSVNEVVLPSTEKIIEELGAADEAQLYEMLAENIDETNAYNMLEAVVAASEVISYPERELNAHKAVFEKNIEARARMLGTTVENIISSDYSGSQVKYDAAKIEYAERECKHDMVVYLLQDIYGFELSRNEYNLCLAEYYEENYDDMGLASLEDTYNNVGQALANGLFDSLAAQALYRSVNG